MKYKLNVARDVDVHGGGIFDHGQIDYILNLPHGFRFKQEIVHVRGYDSMAELKESVKLDVIKCNCKECLTALNKI